ncbi:hypothetical protein AA0116_g12642 [Alternaria tenuissima]|nr:hypothetical protein AA0116_g12642 [Alternaria tenuissima]
MACEDFAKRFLSIIVEVQKSGEMHEQSGKELKKCQEEHEKSSEKLRKSIENLQTITECNTKDLQAFVQDLDQDEIDELEAHIPEDGLDLFRRMLEVRSEEIRRLTSHEGTRGYEDTSSYAEQASDKGKDRNRDTSGSPEDEEDAVQSESWHGSGSESESESESENENEDENDDKKKNEDEEESERE